MSDGISDKLRSDLTAEDVVHGQKCRCGEHRLHGSLYEEKEDGSKWHHSPRKCGMMPALVSLTPELHQRATRIAKHEGKTVEQVVADALTILWVRYATKNGW